MQPRREQPWIRRFLWIAAILCLIWLVIVRGYADYIARFVPARALHFNGQQPSALLHAGDLALREQRLDQAGELAQTVLHRQPLEGRALRLLGAVAELQGNRPRAVQLMSAAARVTPRDTAAQFWLAINALADQDLDSALARLDRLLRFEPALLGDAFPILATIATNPVGAKALAPYLARPSNWGADFVVALIQQAPQVRDVAYLLNSIAQAGGQLSDSQFDLYAGKLIAASDWDRLRALIAGSAPAQSSHLLRDGGFDGQGRGPILGWELTRISGADVRMIDSALALSFYGKRVPFRQVAQLLILAPGSYQLNGRVRLDQLVTEHGLSWTLNCQGSAVPLASSEKFKGTRSWTEFSFKFDVPAACPAQWLRLELYARIAAEQQISGGAWFDDLSLKVFP